VNVRQPGAIGATDAARVFKGVRMSGQIRQGDHQLSAPITWSASHPVTGGALQRPSAASPISACRSALGLDLGPLPH